MDTRSQAARYYDLNPKFPDDLPFYRQLLPGKDSRVLELGCGTGRVLLPLWTHCAYVHGIDLSEAMTSMCRGKLREQGIPDSRARVDVGDISSFDLNKRFDLIIAPFRVLQNLERDDQVSGLLACIRKHLAPHGTCVLNVFNPYADAETLRRTWVVEGEQIEWEVPFEGGRLVCSSVRARMDRERMILYPEMVYRVYASNVVKDEARMRFVMRCYYPDQLVSLLQSHGFTVTQTWGGYENEPYGKGPELVVQFKA